MAESYDDVQGGEKKAMQEGLSRGSQLTGIIHALLTDTHLKETERNR